MADPRSGGALRQRVTTALAMPLDGVTRPADMRRVVLTSGERDIGRLIAQLNTAAKTLGSDIGLSLLLEGQLDAAGLEPLREHGRKLKLGYIADPCGDLAETCAAFAHGPPPLAISAHRHEAPGLAQAMRDDGVQVLLVQPDTARMWSVAA